MNQQNQQIDSDSEKCPAETLSFTSPYAKFSLVLLGVTFITVLPHYYEIWEDTGAVSTQLIWHSVLFLGWYLLFAVQAGLVAGRNVKRHRTLGKLSVILMALLIVSGAMMLLGVMQSFQADWAAEHLYARASFVWAISHTLISFGLFYGLGLWYRGVSAMHKRFMLLASLSMISASVTRIAYLPFVPIDGTAMTLLMTYALLIAPLAIDRVVEGKIHPVLKWGVPAYVATQLFAIAYIPSTVVGREMAFPF